MLLHCEFNLSYFIHALITKLSADIKLNKKLCQQTTFFCMFNKKSIEIHRRRPYTLACCYCLAPARKQPAHTRVHQEGTTNNFSIILGLFKLKKIAWEEFNWYFHGIKSFWNWLSFRTSLFSMLEEEKKVLHQTGEFGRISGPNRLV